MTKTRYETNNNVLLVELLKNRSVRIGLAILLLLVIALIIKKAGAQIIKEVKEKQFDKKDQVVKGVDIKYLVLQYLNAMNPSGISWMTDFDGTNTESIMSLALKTRGVFNKVNLAYKVKDPHGRVLEDALREELSNEDFDKWYNIVMNPISNRA